MEQWDRVLGLRGLQLYYLSWQIPLLLLARRLHRSRPFDAAHHATMTNEWIPSGLSAAGLPALVLGPLGGGERVPPECRRYLGVRGRFTERVRAIAAGGFHVAVARPSARRATLLVAQNEEEAARLRRCDRPVVVSPNVFLDPTWFDPVSPDRGGTRTDGSLRATDAKAGRQGGPPRYRALYVGRLVAWKGIHLALEAMRRPEADDWELHVYGHGAERRRAEAKIRRWGLAERVVLHEPVPRHEVRDLMVHADALLYPSMREAAGWVVAEALAVGCPVVCLEIGGPPLLVGTGGTTVPICGDVPGNLAQAVAATVGQPRRVVRWGDDRAAGLVQGWYERATGRAGVVARPVA